MNLLCRLSGHKIAWTKSYRTNRYHEWHEVSRWHCTRCDASDETSILNDGTLPEFFRQIRQRIRNFFHPCADCGKRFGRHDKTVDHLPF